jgi:hypothetical protein
MVYRPSHLALPCFYYTPTNSFANMLQIKDQITFVVPYIPKKELSLFLKERHSLQLVHRHRHLPAKPVL